MTDHVEEIVKQWASEKPELDTKPMALIGRLKRLNAELSRGMDKVYTAHGLNSSSFDVLATLRRAGAPYQLTPSDLIQRTMVTSGTMTNRLDRLEKEGLIHRSENPKDARGSLVTLTNGGLEKIDSAVTDHVANQQRLLDGLTADDRRSLNSLLGKWLTGFETSIGSNTAPDTR